MGHEEIREGYFRVTQVLQPYSSYAEIPHHILVKAQNRGIRTHKVCEMYMLDEYFPYPDDDIAGYFESFKHWYDDDIIDRLVCVELRLYNDLLRITGQIDIVGVLKGDTSPSVIDIKTSQTPTKSWPLQLAAYRHLYNESDEKSKVKRRLVVQLNKEGKPPKIHEYYDFDKDWRLYQGILEAWRYYYG